MLVACAIIAGTRWINITATAKADRSMPEAIFRCHFRRESRGARTNATASVDALWARLSTTATAKLKEIYLSSIDIRNGRFGLLIFPMLKMGYG